MDHRGNGTSKILNTLIGVLVCLLIGGLLAASGFLFVQLQQAQQAKAAVDSQLSDAKSKASDLSNQNEELRAQLVTVQAETQTQTQDRILKEVGELYALPPTERPNFAQVKDTSQLATQPFFKDAQTGDYLLVFPKAKLSILYRPSEKRIINSGPVEVSQ